VLIAIDDGARTADEIVHATGLAADEVAVALTELELAAFVSVSAGVYRR
jgi:predicted Rossmann fold nucleotide-binding protein DprA/Smf involved in DNA uptake